MFRISKQPLIFLSFELFKKMNRNLSSYRIKDVYIIFKNKIKIYF